MQDTGLTAGREKHRIRKSGMRQWSGKFCQRCLRRNARDGESLSKTVGVSVTHRTPAGKMPVDAGSVSDAGMPSSRCTGCKKPPRPSLHYVPPPPLQPSAMGYSRDPRSETSPRNFSIKPHPAPVYPHLKPNACTQRFIVKPIHLKGYDYAERITPNRRQNDR